MGYTLELLEEHAEFGNVLKFPAVPCHSQGVERSIKLVTKVANKVKSYRRRHEEILCVLYHRSKNPNDFQDPDEFYDSENENSDSDDE